MQKGGTPNVEHSRSNFQGGGEREGGMETANGHEWTRTGNGEGLG